jgi:hypothetical protein
LRKNVCGLARILRVAQIPDRFLGALVDCVRLAKADETYGLDIAEESAELTQSDNGPGSTIPIID